MKKYLMWISSLIRGVQLKTKAVRDMPLVGASLWAVQRIKQTATHALPLIGTDKSNAELTQHPAKWMQTNFREDIVIHSFRHALRDRLRAVQCPSEMIDQIGGWSSGSR